jgi:hypothetical protein
MDYEQSQKELETAPRQFAATLKTIAADPAKQKALIKAFASDSQLEDKSKGEVGTRA